MKKYWKFLATAAVAASVLCMSCNDDEDNGNGGNGGNDGLSGNIPAGTTLTGNVSRDATLVRNGSYKLSGGVHVKAGATLRIEEGVEIVAVDDDKVDYILVEQGAGIDAQGTASAPIVMTSELKEPGAWGGIHICGRAHTNAGEGVLSEIGNAPYGGNDDADCAISGWNTRAMPSTRSTRPTASRSTASATARRWNTFRLTRVPTTDSNSSAARST